MSMSSSRSFQAADPAFSATTSQEAPESTPSGGATSGGENFGELQTLRERNVELMSRISKLRADNKELSNATLQRSYDSERHAEELEAIRVREAELTADFARLNALYNEHGQQLEEDQRIIKKLQATIKEEKAVGAYLVRQFDKKAEDLRAEASVASERFSQIENNLRKELESIAARCADLEAAIRERETTILQLRGSVSAAEEQAEITQSDLKRKLVKTADENWAKDLEIQRLAANEAVFTNQITQLNQTTAQKTQAISRAQEEIEALAHKLMVAEQAGIALRERAKEQATNLEIVRQEHAEATRVMRMDITRELEALRSEATELRERLKTVTQENSALRVENADQRSQVRAAQEETPRLRVEVSEMRAAANLAQELASQLRETVSMQQVEAQHARLEAERQMAKLQADTDAQVQIAQAKAEQTIARAKAESEKELARAEFKAQAGVMKAEQEAERVRVEAAQTVAHLEAKSIRDFEVYKAAADQEIARAMTASQQTVQQAEQELARAKAAINKEISNSDAKVEAALLKAEQIVERVREDAAHKLAHLEANSARDLEAAKAAANQEIALATTAAAQAVQQAEQEVARVKAAAAQDITRLKAEAYLQLKTLGADQARELSAMQSKVENQLREKDIEIVAIRSEQAFALKTQASEFETVKETYERKVARLADQFDVERENSRSSTNKLMSEISTVRAEATAALASYKQSTLDAETKISELNKTVEDYQIQKMRLEARLSEFGTKIKTDSERFENAEIALRTEVATLSAEIEQKSRQIVELTQQVRETTEQASKKVDRAQDECLELMQEVERLQQQVKAKDATVGMQREQLNEFAEKRRELELVRVELAAQTRAIADLKNANESKEQAVDKLTEESDRLRNQLEDQAARFSRLTDKANHKTRIEVEAVQNALKIQQQNAEATRTENVEQARAISELKYALKQKEKELAEIGQQVPRLREELAAQTARFEESTQALSDKARSDIASLQASMRLSFEQKDEATEQLQKQLSEERAKVVARELELSRELEEIEERTAAMSEHTTQTAAREHQLRHYATALTREKQDIMKFSKQIAAEIQMVSATHPLKDYLTATEYELSKVEIQLKTTPVIAPERARLEACVLQLVEQREFLKMILANAQKQFEGQILALEKMVTKGNFLPVPPLPPSQTSAKSKPAGKRAASERKAAQAVTLKSDVTVNPSTQETPAAVDANAPEVRVHWENPSQDLE